VLPLCVGPQLSMALPTQGRVLLDTTAGDIDIELWSKVRDDNSRSCERRVTDSLAGSTESMPEFHRIGNGRYARRDPLAPRMSCYVDLTARSCSCAQKYNEQIKKQAIMTASSSTGRQFRPSPPPLPPLRTPLTGFDLFTAIFFFSLFYAP
jgi:hypothetical protein